MAIKDYYFARKRVLGYGKMFFLKVLQEADDSGGGESLLGTLADEEHAGWGPLGRSRARSHLSASSKSCHTRV